jgi:hypothetical protein
MPGQQSTLRALAISLLLPLALGLWNSGTASIIVLEETTIDALAKGSVWVDDGSGGHWESVTDTDQDSGVGPSLSAAASAGGNTATMEGVLHSDSLFLDGNTRIYGETGDAEATASVIFNLTAADQLDLTGTIDADNYGFGKVELWRLTPTLQRHTRLYSVSDFFTHVFAESFDPGPGFYELYAYAEADADIQYVGSGDVQVTLLIPEPSAVTLVLLGLLALGTRLRAPE